MHNCYEPGTILVIGIKEKLVVRRERAEWLELRFRSSVQMCVWASEGSMANLSIVIGQRAASLGTETGRWIDEVVCACAGPFGWHLFSQKSGGELKMKREAMWEV